ncbi:AraC family transcriptional regulator [Variovorax saccharolyticus]|uniref:AraC family transcriptional regulator n=1 Tax=Variovorax saccharolyticus TaxID=3053516 RepID=UPI002576DFA8|nr:AraC family transcriptional regulator [Variovorax sp. J31P216]MDM0026502.1 AraC family transcriptional regulator [Variovorax sp. J31P216]
MTAMVRSSALQGYATLMHSLGVEPMPLLRRYRIPAGSLTDDDALLSLRSCIHLLEASAQETGCADFGLRLAQVQDIRVLGPLSIALQNAPTVREAWDYTARNLFIHSPGLVLSVHEKSSLIEGASEMTAEVRLDRMPSHKQTIDLCLADLHNITRLLAAEQYELRAVTLPHKPVAPLAVYQRFFGAPVFMEQPFAALHVSQGTLSADLRGANHALRKITEDYLARHFRVPGESVSSRVRLALQHTLGTPQGSKNDVAALLALHPRTLQRHLAAEGNTFEMIREETLKEAALHYLRETEMPLGQLADILGFSEQSAMTRSYRRWFGKSPSALRRELQAEK